MPFFPTLRTAGFPRLRRNTAPQPSRTATEAKLILSDYYTALLNAGVGLNDTAKPWPVERAVAEGYERVVWTFRAVSTIAENGARGDVPFEVVTGDAETPDVVEDHPVSRLLNGQANEMETGAVFRERLISQLLLSKRGVFVETTRSNAGTPMRYDLLPPGRTRIVPGYEAMIDHYEITRRDGSTYKIDPDRVRWIRHPHPLDPYSGVTPLESAGMSVELDYFARLYNVSFLRNDGRPGGVLAIEGDLDTDDLDRIESRFGTGPTEAGKLSVLAGKLSYADLAARPRDMAYGQASSNAKNEILCAFGTPETVLGNSSERTYANAEADGYQFWANRMLNTLSRVAAGFIADLAEGERGQFNTSRIGVLELPERQRREEARAEFEAGLRSVKSYADLAGYGDEIADTPYARALWIPSGRTPMPARPEDAAALGAGEPAPGPGTAPPVEGTPGVPAGETGEGGGPEQPLQVPSERVPAELPPGPAVTAAGSPTAAAPPPPAAAAPETKAAPAAPGGWREVDPADTEELAAAALTAALQAEIDRWAARAAARLRSPRARKGTRHFTPGHPEDTRTGTKALDAAGAVGPEGFADNVDSATRPIVEKAALIGAAAWLTAATGEATDPTDLPPKVAAAALAGAAAAMPHLVAGAEAQARRAAQAIIDADTAGATIDDAAQAFTERGEIVSRWAANAAEDTATAATEAGYVAAARHHAQSPGVEVQQQWISKKDANVRGTHQAAHGQTRDAARPFNVGEALLRYPCDPLGPPGEVKNCRCRTLWRQRRSGRFSATPGPGTP